MKNRSRLLTVLLYIVVFAVAVVLISEVFFRDDTAYVNYSTVCEQFRSENVRSFEYDNGVLTLELRKPYQNEAYSVSHKLADLGLFYEDLGTLIAEQQESGVLQSYNYVPMRQTPWYVRMLPEMLLSIVMIALVYMVLMRNSGGMMKFGHANARVGSGRDKVMFSDVAGADEEKAELQEIVDFLRDPAKYRRIGASRVRDLFEQAKRSAPAIIFIDEIDAVGRRRGAGMGGGHDEREQTLNQLLVEMDGFGSNDGVIVMAATNRRDILDPALLRPGRFDRQIYVNVPDVGGREAILRVHARDKQLSDDVDLRTVARATAGFTGADLENLLNEAALISARKNLPVITMQTMEDAVLKVIAGPEKRSLVNIERDRRITAIHEAGHAVAAYFLPTQEPVHQITIVPRGNALGLTISLPDQDTLHTTRNEMRDRIVVLLGGRVAEQLEFDDISTGASNDLQRATKLAHDMIAKYGMNERIGAVAYDDDSEIFVGRDYERTRSYSEQTAAEIDAEVRKTVDQAYAHCTQILTEHHEKLQEIAQWLLEHETMSRSQFEACMQALPIPEKQEGLLAGEEKTDGAEED